MFRKALLVTSLALATTASLIPAAQAKPVATAAQTLTKTLSGLKYGTGNPAIWSYRLPAPPDERGNNTVVTSTRSDDRGYTQGIGSASTTSMRPDDRGVAEGIGPVATTAASTGSSYDWSTLLAAIGVGLGLVVLIAGGVMTSQRRHGKLAV